MRGGKRPGAGRKPGIRNKASAERERAIAASGLTPLDYMLQTLRDPSLERDVRMDAAAKAAPYVHPRLNSIEHKGDVNLHHDDARSVTSKLLPELATGGTEGTAVTTH